MNSGNNISQKIEAILFFKAEPVAIKKLATLIGVDEKAIREGISELEKNLSGRGISILQTNDEVSLGTAKELSSMIEELIKEELTRDLTKAALETLSIILYQGPISRSEIDYIRGVNSQFTVRTLLVRGLVDRVENDKDARSFLYKPSLSLLSHMGITKIEDLPEYEKVRKEISSIKQPEQATPVLQ